LTRWCERERTSRGGNPGGPFGVRSRGSSSGLRGGLRASRFGCAGLAHFRSDNSDGTPLSSGETEDRSLVENLKRVGCSRKGAPYPRAREGLEAPRCRPPRGRWWKAHEGRSREAGSTVRGERSGEAPKAHESIGFRRLRSVEVRIFAGSKALELRGIVTSWSSEQEHAMPETARGHRHRKVYGSAGGKSSVG
jgi:hypothetical protein